MGTARLTVQQMVMCGCRYKEQWQAEQVRAKQSLTAQSKMQAEEVAAKQQGAIYREIESSHPVFPTTQVRA